MAETTPSQAPPGRYDAIIKEALREASARGKPPAKIAAIKALRHRTTIDLKDAQEVVEDYGRRHGVEPLTQPLGVTRGMMIWLAALIIVAFVLFAGLIAQPKLPPM